MSSAAADYRKNKPAKKNPVRGEIYLKMLALHEFQDASIF
jgi:hypothetical protein